MVGVAGLLRLARWWRQHYAGAPERGGDGGVFPEAAGTAGTPAGAGAWGVDGVDGTVVGGATAVAETALGGGARDAGTADANGDVRR